MCLSNVYLLTDDKETLVCEYASSVKVTGREIFLTDVIGREVTVEGTIESVDLIKNEIKVRAN